MPSEDHTNILQEMRRTATVRGSVEVYLRHFAHRMGRALQDRDMTALYDLHSEISDLGPIVDSIAHGTSVAPVDRDVDPNAPPPATNPGSTGTNVFGSKGPEDTDTQRDTSRGYAGRDVPPAEPRQNSRIPEQRVGRPKDDGMAGGGAGAGVQSDQARSGTTSASSATAVGDQHVSQDRPAGDHEKAEGERETA